jgi:uncharacterized protein RhaS with RHS repeats
VDGTGLQYLRARYYDPGIGRFLSQDPLPGGHAYAYVRNNPVRYVDPSGLNPCGVAVTVAVGVSATTGAGTAGTTVVVTSTGALAVCTGVVLVAVCEASDGGCVSAALDAAGAVGGAIASGGQALVEGAGDVAGEVGGWLGFGKKPKETPKPEPRIDYRYRPSNLSIPQPSAFNLQWRGCGYFTDPRLRAICWTFVADGIAYAIEQLLPIFDEMSDQASSGKE